MAKITGPDNKPIRFRLGLFLLALILVCQQASATPDIANIARVQKKPSLAELAKSIAHSSRSDPRSALALVQIAQADKAWQSDFNTRAIILSESAAAHYYNGEFSLAMQAAQSATQFAIAHHVDAAEKRAIWVIGLVLSDIGDAENALQRYQEALAYYEKQNDVGAQLHLMNNIGNILAFEKQFVPAVQYFKKMELLADQHDMQREKGNAIYGPAWIAELQGRLQEAEDGYHRALDAYGESAPLDTLIAYSALSSFELDRKQPEKALSWIEKAQNLALKNHIKYREASLLHKEAEAIFALGKQDNALKMMSDAEQMAGREGDNEQLQMMLNAHAQILASVGRFEEAIQFFFKYDQLTQKISTERASLRVAVMDAVFQSEHRQREIETLTAQSQIQQLQFDRQRQGLVVASVSVLLLLSMGLFFNYRRTQKRQLAEALRVNAKLRELDSIKDQVLANTSHELRTPLNGIIGLSDLLLLDELPEPVRSSVQMIADSAKRLTTVINDLLDFARYTQDKIQLNLSDVDVANAITQALTICLPVAKNKNVLFRNAAAERATLSVKADAGRLQQILINLINNAIKFTPEGSITVDVSVREDAVRFMVIDTGIGIAADKCERIFESFEQVDNSYTRRYQGAGLGLAICKQLVQLHGGELGVTSTPGQGSTFWFSIPV